MRIAFYAPLKPPHHPVASGDRTMARLLVEALRLAGHEVEIAAVLGSRDGAGDPARQARLKSVGERLAVRYLRRLRHGRRPDLWFTYHLYYKAPDWLGPRVADALAIPYVVAEASLAEKRAAGPWRLGHEATAAALRRADAVFGLSSADREGVLPALADPARWHPLKPFLRTAPLAAASAERALRRAELAVRHDLDPQRPWLIVVAMMRGGDKLASFRVLAAALARLRAKDWHLLLVGDGPAHDDVRGLMAPWSDQARWLGFLDGQEAARILAASDLMVWPAINEAYGMALLEAQAAGVPVLAGASGGVPDIVADRISGRLTPPGDAAAFAQVLEELLADGEERRRLGAAAARRANSEHDIAGAARRIDAVLRGLRPAGPA